MKTYAASAVSTAKRWRAGPCAPAGAPSAGEWCIRGFTFAPGPAIRPGARHASLRRERDVQIGRLAVGDRQLLGLGPQTLMPHLDRVLPGRHVLDLEAAVLTGDRVERVVRHDQVRGHPGVHV